LGFEREKCRNNVETQNGKHEQVSLHFRSTSLKILLVLASAGVEVFGTRFEKIIDYYMITSLINDYGSLYGTGMESVVVDCPHS
jgi:hypothetical protein